MALPAIRYDGTFTTPVEVEGSPEISTDEVTRSRIITRKFAVRRDYYNPLPQGSVDPAFRNAYLANETQGQAQGPIKWFSRIYLEMPVARTEAREISFTKPGKSAAVYSKLTAAPIGWNAYGLAAPASDFYIADVLISYGLVLPGVNPKNVFSIPAVSQLLYQGAPVDYSGLVFISIGNVTVVPRSGPSVVENRFALAGVVTGFASGEDWIFSRQISRWRGPIWQLEVVKIPQLIL